MLNAMFDFLEWKFKSRIFFIHCSRWEESFTQLIAATQRRGSIRINGNATELKCGKVILSHALACIQHTHAHTSKTPNTALCARSVSFTFLPTAQLNRKESHTGVYCRYRREQGRKSQGKRKQVWKQGYGEKTQEHTKPKKIMINSKHGNLYIMSIFHAAPKVWQTIWGIISFKSYNLYH